MPPKQTSVQSSMKPLVSFIIPYYNIPIELLRECIESILSLSLRTYELEIIVVDDGSDVSPLEGISTYADRILLVRQRNEGLSAARNTGIRLATGDYIQFVDADDKISTSNYEHCLDLIRYQHPDVVLFDLTDSSPEPMVHADLDVMTGVEYMTSNNLTGSACSYIFRRNILGELRFTTGIYHEDEEFTPLLLLRADTLIKTDAKAYIYRRRDESITTSRHIRKKLKRLNDAKEIIKRLNKLADTMPANERIALQRRVAQLTMDYIYQVIMTTRSRPYLSRRIVDLSQAGLYPLPDRNYTSKYQWFRKLANSDKGLDLLLTTLPILKRER